MGRKVITVPDAGESKSFGLTGLSVLISDAAAYQTPGKAPLLSFDNPGDQLPILNRSQYPNPAGEFNQVIVTGTPESAGDQITLLSINLCVDPVINTNVNPKSIAGTTLTKGASDNEQSFSNAEIMDSEGRLPKRIYIWVAGGTTAGINYAYTSNPSQGLNATDAMQWDNDQSNSGTVDHEIQLQPLEVVGIDWIEKFNFIATVAGETPNLVWTAEY